MFFVFFVVAFLRTMTAPTLLDIFEARRRIAGRVRRTVLAASPWLSDGAGQPVDLKLESLQIAHSFKLRGAFNALLQHAAAHAGRDVPAVVTASAGNHGRALACAAEALGLRAIVFTPRHAPATKLDAIRRHGARLRSEAADYDEAEIQAKAWARAQGLPFVSPYGQPAIVAGAGTIGVEILEDAPDVDTIVVAIGGGGLASGIAIAAKGIAPRVRIVGVESTASSVFAESVAAGRIVTIVPGETLADGLGGNLDPDTITFDIVRDRVDELVQVSDAEIEGAIRGLVREEHLVAEGAGAAAVAAVASGKVKARGRTVAVVSGANIDASTLARILNG